MEEYAKNIICWLQKRVTEAEAKDPRIRTLKDRINEITKQIESASEVEVPKLVVLQTEAIHDLINHVVSNPSSLIRK